MMVRESYSNTRRLNILTIIYYSDNDIVADNSPDIVGGDILPIQLVCYLTQRQ